MQALGISPLPQGLTAWARRRPGRESVATAGVGGYTRLERDRDVPVTPAGAAFAARLLSAKREVAHAYAAVDLDVGELLRLRESLGSSEGRAPLPEAFLARAAALALRAAPGLAGEGGAHVAVSAGGSPWEGSQRPVVRDADSKSVLAISAELGDALGRARVGTLEAGEQEGAVFSVSSYLGAAAPAVTVTEILEPPQAGAITLGSARQRVSMGRSGPRATDVAVATLTYDATLMDEAEASTLLQACSDFLRNPQSLLL